jgi:DNA gyrase inhibitor GyrI
MNELAVRIEMLPPMRVAAVRVESASPEVEAWERMRAWAEPFGLLDDLQNHPVFGFNNPGPSPGRREYGYEFWLRVAPETSIPADIEDKHFPGGRYAVARQTGFPDPLTWEALYSWVQTSPYKWRKTHELERPLKPLSPESEMVFELYLPIE